LRLLSVIAGLYVCLCIRGSAAPTPNSGGLAGTPAACAVAGDSAPGLSDCDIIGDSDLAPGTVSSQAAPSHSATGSSSQKANPAQASDPKAPVDANGKAIPLEHRQPQRILGFMPNFRSVSAGAQPHPPGWKYNFTVATHQATDYSSFIFLGLTSLAAEGTNEHPALGKGAGGFYAYTWRGFLDKSDNTYLSAWLLASSLHEDTRYYALGNEHSIPIRALYVISRQGVARTYGGRQTPNIAGFGGKVLAQVVSRSYYPPSATSFDVLATKFGYSVMRDVIFSSIREFYPDIAAHFVRTHQARKAAKAAHLDAVAQ
jgi:hypothetical protein